jgi:hypothetical protein
VPRDTIPKRDAFLAAFKLTASITKAAAAAKCERGLHYRWLEEPEYAAAFEAAKEEAAQSLEDEAVRRAHEGVSEPVIWQGQFTYETDSRGRRRLKKPLAVQKYSDTLLIFLLKGMRPEKYRESFKAEISGPGGGPILLKNEALKNLNDDELAGLIALTRKLAAASADGSGVEAPPAE